MCALSAGLLRAALELQGAPLLVVSNATVLVATSHALAVLREVFPRWTPDELAPPEAVLRFAADVAEAGARTAEVTEGDKVMKMSGTRFQDTGARDAFAILTLERVLRPWDMVVDEKVLLNDPLSLKRDVEMAKLADERVAVRALCGRAARGGGRHDLPRRQRRGRAPARPGRCIRREGNERRLPRLVRARARRVG